MDIDKLCKNIKKLLDADFFERYYGKKHVAMPLVTKGTRNLFSDMQLEAIIRFASMKERSPRVFFHGHAVNQAPDKNHDSVAYDHLMRFHKGGASLICNHTQKVSSQIAYLTNFLEHQFECRAHGNLYVTPAKMTAFNPHYDKHDVLVIQLRGSKKWSFFEPLAAQHEKKVYQKDDVKKTEELILKSGEMLYVPQGLIHAAESVNEASWHITLGLTGYYWKDALKDLIDSTASPQNLELFGRLPIRSGNQGKMKDKAIALFEMMKTQVDFTAGLAKFDQAFPEIGSQQPPIPAYGFKEPEALKDHQLFVFRDPARLEIEESEERISLKSPSREHALNLKIGLLGLVNRMKASAVFSAESVQKDESIRDVKLFFSFLMENQFIKPLEK